MEFKIAEYHRNIITKLLEHDVKDLSNETLKKVFKSTVVPKWNISKTKELIEKGMTIDNMQVFQKIDSIYLADVNKGGL